MGLYCFVVVVEWACIRGGLVLEGGFYCFVVRSDSKSQNFQCSNVNLSRIYQIYLSKINSFSYVTNSKVHDKLKLMVAYQQTMTSGNAQ